MEKENSFKEQSLFVQQLNEYEVLGKKGEGGMGIVEEAKDLTLGRTIVWKKIRMPEKISSENKARLEARFKQEAMIQAQLDHPNILPIYSLFQHQETAEIYFTMKKVEGKTLDEFLEESIQSVFQELKKQATESQILKIEELEAFLANEMLGLCTKPEEIANFLVEAQEETNDNGQVISLNKFKTILAQVQRKFEREILSILEKVGNALAHAHEKGIIHRDLKPQNIMIEDYGAVYVMDWGIAKLKGETEETKKSEKIGIIEKEFSSGLETLERPDSMTKTNMMMGTENYIAPEQRKDAKRATSLSDIYSFGQVLQFCFEKIYAENIPEDIKSIINKATKEKKEDRYQEITGILSDLNHYLENQPVSTRKYTPVERFLKFCQRHKKNLAFFGIFIFVFFFNLVLYSVKLEYENYTSSLIEAETLHQNILQDFAHDGLSQSERREKASLFAQLIRKLNEAKQSKRFFFPQENLLRKYPELLKKEALPLYLEDGGYALGKVVVEESFLEEGEKKQLLKIVDEKAIEKEKEHLKKLENWIARSKKGLDEGEVQDFIFEISRMHEKAVYQRVMKEFSEGTEYYIEKKTQTIEEDQHYQYIADIIGRLGNQKAARKLLETIMEMEERKKKLGDEDQKFNQKDIKFIVSIIRALGNLFSEKSKTILINSQKDLELFLSFMQMRRGYPEIVSQTELAIKKMVDENLLQKMKPVSSIGFHRRGLLKSEMGDYQGAIVEFNQAIQLEPKYAVAFHNRGNQKLKLGDLAGAEEDFRSAIQYGHKNAYLGLGIVQKKLGKTTLEILDEGVRLNPNDENAYYNRAIHLNELNQNEKALEDLDKAILISPNLAMAYNNKGMIKIEQGKLQEALVEFNKAIEKDNQNKLFYNNRAHVNRRLGHLKESLADCNRAISIAPKFAPSYHGRALVKQELGDQKGALEDMNHALRLEPQDATIFNDRGVLKMSSGKLDAAYSDFKKVVSLNPNYPDALNNLGAIKLQFKDFQGAVLELEKAIKLKPNYSEAYFNLGRGYWQLKKMEPALKAFAKGLEYQKNEGEAEFLVLLLLKSFPTLQRTKTPAELRFYLKLFIKFAPANHPKLPMVKKALQSLENKK